MAVTATDPNGSSSVPIIVTIKVVNVNESPKFEDEDQADKENLTSARYKENTSTTTAVSTYTATDDENGAVVPSGQVLIWALSGNDADHFSLCSRFAADPPTSACVDSNAYTDVLDLRFKESPNFEARADSNGDSVYNVTVEATDSDDNTTSRRVVITLLNEDDPGKVTLSNREPQSGSDLAADLTDPDEGISSIKCQWQFTRTVEKAVVVAGNEGA